MAAKHDRVQLRCLWQACSGAAGWLDVSLGHGICVLGCGHQRRTTTSLYHHSHVEHHIVQKLSSDKRRNLRRGTFGLWFGLYAWDDGIQVFQY